MVGEVTAGGGGGDDGAELFQGRGGAGGFLSVVDVPVITQLELQQFMAYENVEVPQIQFIVTVLDIPVATQRRLPTVQTVLKTGESHRCSSWTRLMTPVAFQRLVPGRDRAENCGGSAVAQVVDVPVVQFVDAVIMQRQVGLGGDMPVVATTGAVLRQGVDMPVVYNDRGLTNSRGASDSVVVGVGGHSCCATETGTQFRSGGYGGD